MSIRRVSRRLLRTTLNSHPMRNVMNGCHDILPFCVYLRSRTCTTDVTLHLFRTGLSFTDRSNPLWGFFRYGPVQTSHWMRCSPLRCGIKFGIPTFLSGPTMLVGFLPLRRFPGGHLGRADSQDLACFGPNFNDPSRTIGDIYRDWHLSWLSGNLNPPHSVYLEHFAWIIRGDIKTPQ